jgi:hypothetical protein
MNTVPPLLVAVAGLALLLAGALRRGHVSHAAGAALLLFAAGAFVPLWLAKWLALAALAALTAAGVLLLLTGLWSRHAAAAFAALGVVGLGGVLLPGAGTAVAELASDLATLRLRAPAWLLLLLALPLIVHLSRGRLTRHEARPWLALGLRLLGVALLSLALAEPYFAQSSKAMTVLFVVDRSLSIPEEPGEDEAQPGVKVDKRTLRILKWINDAVAIRGSGHEHDQAGLIIFGRTPRLELPPSDAPRFNLTELPPADDGNYTNIEAALKLALASFPEGSARRIVLVSDGNQNLGDADKQAALAKSLGVQIDVLPLAAGRRNEEEVLVERVDAPAVIEQGARVPVRVLVRSHNPDVVVGRLVLRQITEKEPLKIVGVRDPARLRFGLNPFSFDRPLTDEQRSYTYEAEFQPLLVEDENGKVLHKGLPGDRVQNNRASTHVVARGQGRILLLENEAGQHKELVERLVEAGKGRFKVVAEPVDVLDNYKERDKLAVFLSNFDFVILANVPAERVSEEQQEVIRANTHDQGCGLVMIGGPDGFGAGGWQNTPVEKALPVDCDIRSLKVQGKGGLVLIMHACEMARGNYWERRIAKLAIDRLGPADEVGIIDYDFNHKWHVKMQPVGPNRASILAKIDKMVPGDMPDFDPPLQMAHDALMDKAKDYGARHIIIISDGDPMQNNRALLQQIKADNVTIATVGVATHGAPEDQKMTDIASPIKGTDRKRYYKVTDPKQLPAIYIKESRLVSQAFVYRKEFTPRLLYRSGPTAKLPDLLTLGGFVRTTRKESPLVEVPIASPPIQDQEFPILAYWHYGLGKAVAFTSDAGQPEFWSRRWVSGAGGREGIFAGFWEQVLGWALRPVESGRLLMNTEVRDGKVRIVVEARGPDGKPDTSLRLRGGLTTPGGKGDGSRKQELRFAQKSAGQYEAEVKAEEAGSYFLTAQATRVRKVKKPGEKEEREEVEGVDSVRAGVTLPYSPEFADLESNTTLLERLREMTDGRTYTDDAELLAEAAKEGAVFRPPMERPKSALPFHYWLLFLAAGLLLLDVAVRRLAFDAKESAEAARVLWARLRGFPLPPPQASPALGRLRARAATEEKAGRRYEGARGVPVPGIAGAPAPARPAVPAQESAPQPEAQPGGLEELLKAKKRVWEERKADPSGGS